ncbi:MAG: hypothetical protein HQ448_08885 [Cytophagales bacterium]|nr:hypothetical protein [Cytophagales bacterium]
MRNLKFLLVFISTIAISALFNSCSKPFEGVSAILSNSYIDHRVSVQVVDANPKSTTYYPANAVITLTGDAIKKGLVYSADGAALNESSGNAKLVNNTITLAIKPYYKITSAAPIKFTITAEAPNYITNTQDVVVTSLDSLQYVNVKILKPSALPVGVAYSTSSAATNANGATTKDIVVAVGNSAGGSSGQPQVAVSITAGTVFKDASNNPIISDKGLSINTTSFSGGSNESISAIQGGLDNVSTSAGNSTFILGAAVNVKAFLGGVAVKSFSTPIPVVVNLPATMLNPSTKSTIKVGDIIPVWSKSEGIASWIKEGTCVVEIDPATGLFKATMLVTHLSTWMTAFNQEVCASSLKLNYSSNNNNVTTLYVAAYAKDGNGQLITGKVVSAKNGDVISFDLPKGVDVNVKMFAGSSDNGTLIQTVAVAACASSANLTNNQVITNPTLFFDLQTVCKDGTFRYTGDIFYKVSGTNIWEPFTPSVNGTLTTNLLEWSKTYDFRIIYKGTEFARTRQVLQSEFRTSGGTWSFFGKTGVQQTFFNAPTSCQ